MGRQTSAGDREAEHRSTDQRPVFRRLGGLAVVALLTVLVLAGCGEQQPFTTITPQTAKAEDIQWLYEMMPVGTRVYIY